MSIVPAAQPMSRRVKALRLREPLMQRQMARRVERRKREDEAWARIEDEEQLLRSTNGRDRLQDGRDKMEENRKVHEEALDQDQALAVAAAGQVGAVPAGDGVGVEGQVGEVAAKNVIACYL